MLQPRLSLRCDYNCGFDYTRRMSKAVVAAACIAVLFSTLVSCQDGNINEEDLIEATRIKRDGQENRDLTVLLVNDQKRGDYNAKIGRYHSVKPLIGLLTSTARTFIQDGVTTEFATQILGTTLDNGRIYAQLLTKSSLVLYNKPSKVEDAFVKPTKNNFHEQWNVKQDLGFIDPDKFVLKNSDYLAPSSKMDIVYASKSPDNLKYWSPPTSPESYSENQIDEEPTGRKVPAGNFVQNEAINFLDAPNESEKFIIKPSILENINTLHRQSKAFEVNPEIKVDSRFKEEFNDSNVVKVKPNHGLPTFTIKNEFSPIFYYIDNVESKVPGYQTDQQSKMPKRLFGQKSEARPKKTFTYVGFADFTTVVGDSVIIFTPNTDTPTDPIPGQVNVFPSAKRINKLANKITSLSADIPLPTATFKGNDLHQATKLFTLKKKQERPENNDNDDSVRHRTPDIINLQYNNGFDFNADVIQPSESLVTTTDNTRMTDDLGVIPLKSISSVETEPLGKLKPSSISFATKESAIAEINEESTLTDSEEETENTAAEVTEKTKVENEDETEFTSEDDTTILTTTESGHSDESSEEVEGTTESYKPEPEEKPEENPACASGVEIVSTMTTAYKTLTYLTTYFIPLKTGTISSIKSDVVVESNVGYLTNYECKPELVIEPTALFDITVQPSLSSSSEEPQSNSEEITESTQKSVEAVTEKQKVTTESNNKLTDTTEELTTNESSEVTNDSESSGSTTSTTERVSTSHSHVEVSVSTEHSTTTTEKITTEKDVTEEKLDTTENEIDVIYKTLYTTYTYFTTFFGDSTPSVASHKSIVTNVITSSLDLSKLDPSLLGVFNEDEIAPSNVGIGRPTELFGINSIIDLVKNKDVIESVENGEVYNSQTPTPTLGLDEASKIMPDAVKTYFTTYTFFTTIYVGIDANVCSRSEVYTNYVGPDELIPTKTTPRDENTKAQFDFRNCKQIKGATPPADSEANSSVESSVSMEANESQEDNKQYTPNPTPVEVDMLFSVESGPIDTNNAFVTDVKSSSSKGEQKYIENNNILEDQISSESNIEEIMPSPTLLLQTSYTTFTYFTTMYIGKDSSKVKSRLETITNVVTETIMPKSDPVDIEESNLPITYYTTFTYWTTLYKDKLTTITSREEIVSNVVTPSVQVAPTISPIDTTPIDIESVLPPKELEVEVKPSVLDDSSEQEDGKATFYTTYTYFTTFYVGNTSEIRSSLETVTNIVDNTKLIDDNQLGRKVQSGSGDQNLIQDDGKPKISPSVVKEEIKPTSLPDLSDAPPTVLSGTYIDNLFAEVKPVDNNSPGSEPEKKILYSQVAVITGDSVIVTNDNKTLNTSSSSTSTTTTEGPVVSPISEVIESSVPDTETTTESKQESEEEDDGSNSRKKSRLTFTAKKPTFTPVIRPFASRNRPTFSPKRVPLASGATVITRSDFTPTITATPTLKTVRPSGFGANRKQSAFPASPSSSRRFSGRNSLASPSSNVPSPSRAGGFPRGSIQPTSRRSGFRSSSIRGNNADLASRSAVPRIRPTASSRLRGSKQSASVSLTTPEDLNESDTYATQQEENVTEALEEVTEAPARATTNNPLLRFRRPLGPLGRQPGTSVTQRSTTQATTRRTATTRGRLTTTTRRTTTRATTNPLLSLRRQRPSNALFPRRNLFKQPEPEPEEEIKENEQDVDDNGEEVEGEEQFEVDNDYDSSDRKEQQVSTPRPSTTKRNSIQIRPFKRRLKRQVDYGNRKYTNFRRPGVKPPTSNTRRSDPEPETEPPTAAPTTRRPSSRFSSRLTSNSRTTTSAPALRSTARQPFAIRSESRTTTTAGPSYRSRNARTRTTTSSTRPKAPRLQSNSRPNTRTSGTSRSRSRTSTTTNRANSRQRNSYENHSGERVNYNHLVNDGKITVTHQIPVEVTISSVNGKNTEYKNILTAKPSLQTLLENQISTSLGPLGNQQLYLANEVTELVDNGATRIIKFLLHETPTNTVVFTPTTIRGRKTSYSHILPSTIYNVERITSTINPEIGANVPLANLLLSQLLLGNQQQAVNPLLALQGQGLIPQQPVVATPVTEFKTRLTSYVTTVTDARETVLTITFRGTPIETTIKDPTINVITATEYITETIVSTPTVLAQAPQFNSLLLPLLLQQQQQQQQALSLQTQNPLLGLGNPDLSQIQNNNLFNNDIYSNSPKPNILSDLVSNEDFGEEIQDPQDINEDIPAPPPPPKQRPRPRPAKPTPPKLTSVVTLYVSGRTPGEFSTVLSTIVSDDTQGVRKREAIYYEDVKILPSILPSVEELLSSQTDDVLENSVLYESVDNLENPSAQEKETQSLESIVGELSKHIRYDASPTYVVKLARPSVVSEQTKISVDDIS